jgi:serralysin
MAIVVPTGGAPTGNIYIDALVWGSSWASLPGPTVNLTWRAVTMADTYRGLAVGPAWTAFELGQLRQALQAWSNVANITFTEVNAGTTDLDYVKVSDLLMTAMAEKTVAGFHEVPAEMEFPLTGVFNYEVDNWGGNGLKLGGAAFETLLHEIGHGLGLAHPHDGGGDGQRFPGVLLSSDLGDNQLNQGVWTIMSYNRGWNGAKKITSGVGGVMTPMALDIAAIQAIYGANTTYRPGADAYYLPVSNAVGANAGWSCLWDTGGNDTIIAEVATTNVTIDLRDAPLVGPNAGGYISRIAGVSGGFTIAHGVVIENAIGGLADDTLRGNDAANVLNGGSGDDSLNGAGGNDRLFGEFGNDTLAGGSGNDSLVGEWGADSMDGGSGSDTLLGGGDADLLAAGGDNDFLSGGPGADTLRAGTGNDIATGDDGDDSVAGNEGNDNLAGGEGDDTVGGDSGKDTIFGEAGDDLLFGGSENDSIDGGAGLDAIIGGTGNDSLDGGLDADAVQGDAGADTILGNLGDDHLYGGDDNDLLNGGAGNDTVLGEAGNDRIYGLDGADQLDGDAGNDTILGDLGDDFIHGGAGDDSIHGGDGDDLIAGETGSDVLSGGRGADRFIYTYPGQSDPANGIDIILDFSVRAGDRIDLSFVDANLQTFLVDEAFAFLPRGPGRAGPAAGDLWVQAPPIGGGLYVFGETTGDRDPDLVIFVSNVSTLTASAFIL